MNSRLRDILTASSYTTAVNAGHLAVLALTERRSADRVLRVYSADDQVAALLRQLLAEIEFREHATMTGLWYAQRTAAVADIEAALSEMTRKAVSYDDTEAEELLRQLRDVSV